MNMRWMKIMRKLLIDKFDVSRRSQKRNNEIGRETLVTEEF
jgi:hypothetical protein